MKADEKPPERPGRWRRRLSVGLLAVTISATAVRFVIRDASSLSAPFYYATPPVVIALLAAVGLLIIIRRPGRLRTASAVNALIQCGLVAALWQNPVQEQGEMRVAFWNACSGNLGWDGIVNQAASWDADIIGFAESTLVVEIDDPAERRDFWKKHFPGHHIIRLPRGMRLLSRYPGETIERGPLGERSHFGVVRIQVNGAPFYVVMADLVSGPTFSRGPAFVRLREVLNELPDGPVLLLGDMNTPTESAHLDQLRTDLTNAFEAKGQGLYLSWPMVFPVLPLDQIWVNEQLVTRACRLEWTVRSDHRPMIAEVSFAR